MRSRSKPILPLYQKVKKHILDQIEGGKMKPGDRVASENELVKLLNISRMTVNRALRELTDEGYLVRMAGVGTFVAEIHAQSHLLQIHNIADEVSARGHHYAIKILKHEDIKATNDILNKLSLPKGARVFHSLIIHFEQNIPIQLEDRYVNPDIFPGYIKADFTKMTPTQYLLGEVMVQKAEHIVSAISPDKNIRKNLDMPKEEPCLLLTRTTWVRDEKATFSQLYHPASRYQLRDQFTV